MIQNLSQLEIFYCCFPTHSIFFLHPQPSWKISTLKKINLFMIRFLSYFAYFDLFQRCQIISTRSYNKPTGCQILTDLSLGYECQNNHVQT